MDGLDSIREVLSGDTIDLYKLDDDTGIFDHVDAFVNLSRENKTVEEVTLYLATDPDDDRYAIWDKIAEGIGNLQALLEIIIADKNSVNDVEDPHAPDWEILACILRRLPLGVQLRILDDAPLLWDAEALPAFARVIQGHAMITGFSAGDRFPFQSLDILCSAFLTLPALGYVSFAQLDDDQGPEEGQSLESMIKLLQSPSLREVEFESIVFTNTLSQAVAKALKGRSEITVLAFLNCSFPDGGSTAIASALETNTTLKCLNVDNDACSWREALSFLRTNTALKTLYMDFDKSVMESRVTTIRMEVVAALRENKSLETLSMNSKDARLEDYLKCVAAIQPNTTLKKLQLHTYYNQLCLDVDEMKDLIPVLKKNYGLEEIPEISYDCGAGDIRSIFELNRAGRRYLIQDGSSISKGVAVLSRVSNHVNSVFLHLLENPRLCDRTAVEMSSSSIGNTDNAGSTSPGNRHIGDKREQEAPSQSVKETRRRLG
jgi:hypothetical protein